MATKKTDSNGEIWEAFEFSELGEERAWVGVRRVRDSQWGPAGEPVQIDREKWDSWTEVEVQVVEPTISRLAEFEERGREISEQRKAEHEDFWKQADAHAVEHVEKLQRENPFPVRAVEAASDALEIAKRLVREDRHAFYDWIEKNVPINHAEAYAAAMKIVEDRHEELSFADRVSAARLVSSYGATPAKEMAEAERNTIEGWKKLGFSEEEAKNAEKWDEPGPPITMGDEEETLKKLRDRQEIRRKEMEREAKLEEELVKKIASTNPEIPVRRDDLIWILSWARSGIAENAQNVTEENALLERASEIHKLTEI